METNIKTPTSFSIKYRIEPSSNWNYADPVVRGEKILAIENFDPCKALHYGILGIYKPTVTRSEIEGIACCNALNGWG